VGFSLGFQRLGEGEQRAQGERAPRLTEGRPKPSFPCAHSDRSGKRYGRTMRTVVGSLVTLSTTEASAITPLPATTVTFAYPRLRFV